MCSTVNLKTDRINNHKTFMPHVLYLGGDSYPGDAHCEEQVITELTHRLGLTFTRQTDLIPIDPEEQKNWLVLSSRYEQIQKKLDALTDKETIILIGRSSGSRVATSFAYTHSNRSNPASTKPTSSNIAAVICFAYPFRAPHQTIEPSRFEHLADINIPTLIIQGTKDEYGGPEVTANYALSPSIELLMVEGDHGVNLSIEDWEKTFKHITGFLTKAVHQYKTKRAQTQSKYSQIVFNRCVYYFGDVDSNDARHHYAAYMAQATKHNQQQSNIISVTPLQWDLSNTFWEITTQTHESDSTTIHTSTNYQFFEWSDIAQLAQRVQPRTLWRTVQRFKNVFTSQLKSAIFKRNKNIDTEQQQQIKRFITRIISGQDTDVEKRIAQQATGLIARMRSNEEQEILVIGQGVGSVLAAKSLLRAYEIYPALFEQKTKINLLTCNLTSLLSDLGPEADTFKRALNLLSQTTGLQSKDVDLQPQTVISSFALQNNTYNLNTSHEYAYDYIDMTAGAKRFSEIFALKILPEVPEDFDPTAYLQLNPDVAQTGLEPIWHWQHHGATENRPYQTALPLGFDASTYLELNPDVAASGVDAAHHYIIHGARENRRFI